MKVPVTKSFRVEDGSHKGIITEVNFRDKPHKYTDLVIEFQPDGFDKKIQLTVGFPTVITNESRLGRLLKRFGVDLVEDTDLEPDKILVNKPCSFMTLTEKNDNGSFTKVIHESVKPIE